MTFQELRTKYQKLVFAGWQMNQKPNSLELVFDYRLVECSGKQLTFKHGLTFNTQHLPQELELEGIIFQVGLVELISYWKLACPRQIEVQCGQLTNQQKRFWQKLIYKGLGEFIYLNRLHLPEVASFRLTPESFVELVTTGKSYRRLNYHGVGNLIPIGGGKDSVVSLEVLRSEFTQNLPLVMSAPVAAYDCIKTAGYSNYLEISRRLDPQIIELNRAGFLNGHVPFSAMLAFVSVLGAVLTGKRNIILSNENSANEASVPGTDFNHQYSKSLEFEADLRDYLAEFVISGLDYFSLLRPLEELQITELFSHYKSYHPIFRSCNVGKKTNSWCGHCPKCLFVFIMLAAFLDYPAVVEIFGKDLLADRELLPVFRQLLGLEPTKPFECVGTISEVRRAMQQLIERNNKSALPFLAKQFLTYHLEPAPLNHTEEHFVPAEFLAKLNTERQRYGVL